MPGVFLTNHFRYIHGNHGARASLACSPLLKTRNRIAGVG
jgi:hypothetical protein